MSSKTNVTNDVPFADLPDGDLDFARPSYRNWSTVEVCFGSPVILEKYAQRLHFQIKSHASISWTFTADELLEYLRTLVSLRIAYVRMDSITKQYPRWYVIPSTVNVILSLIGRCSNELLGVELVPCETKGYKRMAVDKFVEISNSLRALETTSISYTLEGPRNRDGDWHFMMLENAHGIIQSAEQTPCHVSYALAASFLEAEQMVKFFNPMLSYGPANSYEHVLDRLVK